MMKTRLLAVAVLLVACVTVLHAVATYPSGIASFPTRVNGQTIDATWFNSLQDEVIAIETGLINGFGHVLKPSSSATYDLGTSALLWNKLYVGSIYQSATNPYTGWTVVTSTNTGTQNDFAPGLVGNTVVRMNNATLATITGFAGGYDGQCVQIVSIGAGEVDLSHQDAASTAANREILFATSGKTPLAPGSGVALECYDGTTSRWRLITHEQGAWITRTFAAGNYTASGSLTWTVASATTDAYRLSGRTLMFAEEVSGTLGGVASSELHVTLPSSYTAARKAFTSAQSASNGTNASSFAESQVSTAYIRVFTDNVTFGSWATTGTGAVNFTVTVEVQ